MTISPMTALARQLRRGACPRDEAGLTDEQLLTDFVERRDEAAFADLVLRHGPMVWRVCRRALANRQDAEDAFQGTFLVLVRKAASVRPREMLANWLYGVARTTAHRARVAAARRRVTEGQVTPMPERPAVHRNPWDDLRAVLDLELSRLPAKYRILIVLCDLENRSRKEVARQLGIPAGTVAGRLARARALLARRLTRQGITLPCGVLVAGLVETAAGDVPPAALSSAVATTSVLAVESVAAGVIPPRVVTLTEGVLKAMWLAKLKTTARLAVVLVGVCLAALAGRGLSQPPVTPPQGMTGGRDEATRSGDEPPADEKPPRTPELGPNRDEPDGVKILGTWRVVKGDPTPFHWTFSAGDAQHPNPRVELRHPGDRFLIMYELAPKRREIQLLLPSTGKLPEGSYVLDGDVLVLTWKNLTFPAELITATGAGGSVVLVLKREQMSGTGSRGQDLIEPGEQRRPGPEMTLSAGAPTESPRR
jgi:RNA polymerase sigma factor (sigma-70 family)